MGGTIQDIEVNSLFGPAGGDLSGFYPNPLLVNTAVTGQLLVGYVSGVGIISAADSILSAIQKLNGNISAIAPTLAQVLANGNLTNEISIFSNNGFSHLHVRNTFNQMGFDNGAMLSSLFMSPTQTSLVFDDLITNFANITLRPADLTISHTLSVELTAEILAMPGDWAKLKLQSTGLFGPYALLRIQDSTSTIYSEIEFGLPGILTIDSTTYTELLAPIVKVPSVGVNKIVYTALGGDLTAVTIGTGLTFTAPTLSVDFAAGYTLYDARYLQLTGNTIGTCIPTLFVSTINSCSPLLINPTNAQNIIALGTPGVGQFLIGTTTVNPTALGILRIGQGTSTLDFGQGTAGFATIWLNQVIPSVSNYALKTSLATGDTALNARSGAIVTIRVADNIQHTISSTTTTIDNNLILNGSLILPYTAISGTYTVLSTDYTVNITSGTFTVTFPTAVGIQGRVYVIKNSGSGSITLAGNSGQTFDGVASPVIFAGNSLIIQSNNVNWTIIG